MDDKQKSWVLVTFSSILIIIVVMFFLSLAQSSDSHFEAEDLFSQVGTVSNDPIFSGGAARYAMANDTGFQIYGPYIPLDRGDCTAKYTIWIQEASPGDTIATFDVFSGTVINRTTFKTDATISNLSKIEVYLPFYSNGEGNFEFRVLKNPGVNLWVDAIDISPGEEMKLGYQSILIFTFGCIFVLFLVRFYLFNRAKRSDLKTVSFVLFGVIWLFYIAIVFGVFGPTHSPITGDEPHYVLATHSLVYDRDLNLKNNYENRDYALFYPGDLGDDHTVLTKNGEKFPIHEVGLIILFAIPYSFFGVIGIKLLMTVIGALLILNTFLLLYHILSDLKISIFTSLIIAFTSPILFYSHSIYPETVVALCLVVTLRVLYDFIPSSSCEYKKLLLIGLLLGSLPWFGIKYVAISLPMVLLFGYFLLKDKFGLLIFIAPVGALFSAYLLYLYSLFGMISPGIRYVGLGESIMNPVISTSSITPALLLAYFFGKTSGLIVYSPIYILFFIGILAVFFSARRKYDIKFLVIILTTFFSYYILYASSQALGGRSPPSRPMVAVIPIICIFVGYGVLWMSRARQWASLSTLVLVSVGIGVILFKDQSLLFNISKADGIFLKTSNILPGFPDNELMSFIILSSWLLLFCCIMILEYGLNNLLQEGNAFTREYQ